MPKPPKPNDAHTHQTWGLLALASILFLSVLLAGCRPNGSPTPARSPTALPTASPSATATSTLSPTAAPTSSPTTTPTALPTTTPTALPTTTPTAPPTATPTGPTPPPTVRRPLNKLASIWSTDRRGQVCRLEPQAPGDSDGFLPNTTVVWLIDQVTEAEWSGRRGVPPSAIWHQVRADDERLCWVRQTGLLRLDGGLSYPRNTPLSEIHSRQEILSRARPWIADEVAYAPENTRDGYPTDTLGYVRYAWLLPPSADLCDPAAAGESAYLREVADLADLTPGDVLCNEAPGAARRAVIFYHWHDRVHRRFQAFEMSGVCGAAIHTVLTLSRRAEGWAIAEYVEDAPGPYRAWERIGLVVE